MCSCAITDAEIPTHDCHANTHTQADTNHDPNVLNQQSEKLWYLQYPAGSLWGVDFFNAVILYKCFVRPVLEFVSVL